MATTRTHGIFINTAGLLYASLGFSLSVLAALLGIFYAFISPRRARTSHTRPHVPRKPRKPRIVRSFSDQAEKVTVTRLPERHSVEVEKECNHDVKSLRRRSKSLVPIITIDHFGSTNSPDLLNTSPKPVPNTDGAAADLSITNRSRIKRRCSSPLISHRATSPSAVHSAHDSLPVSSRKESKSTRKSPSVADLNQETFTMKFDSFFLRKAGKKKSLTLRTQPYGPPHFCPPPLPPLPISDHSLRVENLGHDSQR